MGKMAPVYKKKTSSLGYLFFFLQVSLIWRYQLTDICTMFALNHQKMCNGG